MKRTIRFSAGCAILAALLLALGSSAAQQPPTNSDPALELIERERTRAAVESAFGLATGKTGNGAQDLDNLMRATHDLVAIGDAAIPYLVNELEQANPTTFFFAAYSLGHFEAPESTAALERALERADEAPGEFAISRKGWAAYGLALQGKAEAVDRVNEGARRASHVPIHADVTVVEAAAILTAPESVPLLIAQLDEYAERGWWRERRYTLDALGRVLDERAIPAVVRVLEDEDPGQRRSAAAALHRAAGNADAVAALATAIADDDFRVRRAATRSLEEIAPTGPLDAAIARLAKEEDAVVRGRLYRWIVEVRGEAALETLRPYWPSEDANDRFQFLTAIEALASPASLDILEAAAVDPDSRVMVRAFSTLADLGRDEGEALLREQTFSTFWPRAQACIEHLSALPSEANGRVLAERLVKVELATKVTDPRMRYRLELLGDSLVKLGYDGVLPELRRQLEIQDDPAVHAILESTVRRLELIESNRKKTALWIEAADADERVIRELAYRRLSELGDKKSAAALVRAFGRAEVEEGVLLLDLMAAVDRPEIRELLRRVLVDAAFDDVAYWPLRDMAAWSARRLGGSEMIDALREAVERRDGRDAYVLCYLLLLAGKDALPTLEAVSLPRMRYLKYTRGYEYETFKTMGRYLRTGHPLTRWDLPPSRVNFR